MSRRVFASEFCRRAVVLLRASVLFLAGVLLPIVAQGAMVAHWGFENDLLDASANANHLSVGTGAISYGAAAPIAGSTAAGSFNGATMLQNITPSSFGFSSSYSFAAWLQAPLPGVSGYYGPFWVGVPGSTDIEIYTQATSNDMIVVHNRSNGGTFGASVSVDPPNNVYYHLAVTYDGTNTRVYYDGVLQSTTAMAAPQNTAGRQVAVGKLNHALFGPNFYNGLIDEAFVFDTALTPLQIANLMVYNATSPPPPTVPEPAVWTLLGLGAAGLVWRRRMGCN